jgi:hypothetical protein
MLFHFLYKIYQEYSLQYNIKLVFGTTILLKCNAYLGESIWMSRNFIYFFLMQNKWQFPPLTKYFHVNSIVEPVLSKTPRG